MKTQISILLTFAFLLMQGCSKDTQVIPDQEASSMYFPPVNSSTWKTISSTDLGWNTSAEQALQDFLEEKNTEAFMVLKDGRIAIEWYFGDFTANKNHSWNSAAKTLVSVLTGIAQEEGHLTIDEPSSTYLGVGWSSLTPEQEQRITIKHHLTMTTGLDYTVENTFCSDKECLIYKNEPNTYWYYHNATYSLLDELIATAVDQDFKSYFNAKIKNKIGMQGTWLKTGFLNLYYSTARSMSRYGLLNLNDGVWDGETVLSDTNYLNAMKNSSQDLNKSYGYLWWLNGKNGFKLPDSETDFSGKLIPSAPDDLYAGLGALDQKLYVVPSKGLVIVRMGGSATEIGLAPTSFDEELWQKINDLIN